jgi:hypothetical protein
MIVSSGKFSQALYDKNIKTWVSRSVAKLASEMPYYKELADNQFTDEEMFAMLDGVERGIFTEIPENGKVPEEENLPGFKTIYAVHDFGLTKKISHVAGRADASAHRQLQEAQRAADLGRAYIRKLNQVVTDVVKRGFTTTYTSYGDAKPFFSTSHTRIDGGSATYRSNASSTGVTLNYANLKTQLRLLRRSVNGAGEIVDYSEKPVMLIVPTALVDAAYEAVGINQYAPDGADFKPRRTQNVEVYVCPLLGAESTGATGSDTAWYLKIRDLGNQEPIKVFHREGLKIASTEDFDTRSMKTRGTAAFAVGWSDPVGAWVGSKGDGAAYSS